MMIASRRHILVAAFSSFALTLLAAPASGAHIADFDGDGHTDDVLLRDGDFWHVFSMEGAALADGATEAPGLPGDADWRVAGVGDLNGDGRADVLFRHANGAWSYYAMNGRQVLADASGRPGLPESLAWGFAGIGDLNGDGNDDVLLRHEQGRWLYYPADGRHRIASRRQVGLPNALSWRFAGIGDLDGDGTDDVLLRHVDGRWSFHAMRGGRVASARSGPADIAAEGKWRLAGIGDLNGDGADDVLLRDTDGFWLYQAMDGRRVLSGSGPAEITNGKTWRLAGIGDLDGDGTDDVLLRKSDGGWYYYAMNGRRSVAGSASREAGLPRNGAVSVCGETGDEPSYVGYVSGFTGAFDDVEVLLTGRSSLQVTRPDPSGCFAFRGVPAGLYAIKVTARGHSASPGRVVHLPLGIGSGAYDDEPHVVEMLATDPFVYHWEEDQTAAGAEYSSYVVEPRVVEFHGTVVEVADRAAADALRQRYNILLAGKGWSQEHAYRLLDTMASIPQEEQAPSRGELLGASIWHLTDDYIDGDIAIVANGEGTREVTVSGAAFVNATPRIATVDGKRGIWFSRRLHHAAVRFVTDHGRDENAFEMILQERYGVTTRVPDYPGLTGPTGNESAANFQRFHANEVLLLINMLEEMPAGMRKLAGMRYLLRRLDGQLHPLYPTAPAVAWPTSEYVEFMESAFKQQTEDYMHRLIIHEKAHFLWEHLFDDQLKADWSDIGGWYPDPDAESGWSTSRTAEFVSAYAHLKNPNEDMAETISYFIINPDRLRSRSVAKYEFVRDRIMRGDIYVALIREDLTFEVYNLFPDYVYPGKIRQVDITVEGAPATDKTLTVAIELHALDLAAEGAAAAHTRITSSVGTILDLQLDPVDEYGERLQTEYDVAGQPLGQEGTRLGGSIGLSRYAKAGYWVAEQVRLYDAAGNERYLRTSDFGWRMYVDNPLEDYRPPAYVTGSMSVGKSVWEQDGTVQVVRLDWLVDEDTAMRSTNACIAVLNDDVDWTYSHQKWGGASPVGDVCTVEFLMPNYMPSGTWSVDRISMFDEAKNKGTAIFVGDAAVEAQPTFELETTSPDTKPPELDVNRITVSAEPTVPDAPNGETKVTVSLRHRDDISGLSLSTMVLRDPQGGTHHFHLYPDDRHKIYPSEDPSRWQVLERVVFLPAGSVPGTWGIAEITLGDRARNSEQYNFVETVYFDVAGG